MGRRRRSKDHLPIISSVAVVTIPIGGGSGDRTGGSQRAERNARTIIVAVMTTAIIADINYRRWSRIVDSCRAREHRGGRRSGNCPESNRTGDCDNDRTLHCFLMHDNNLLFLRAVSQAGNLSFVTLDATRSAARK
jgi:hypothetical protein